MRGDTTKLSQVISYLETLKQLYEAEVIPNMIDDGDENERIEEIEELIKWLNKTN